MAGGRTRPTVWGFAAIGIVLFSASSALMRLATAESDEVVPELRWLLLGILAGLVLVGGGFLCMERLPARLEPFIFLMMCAGLALGPVLAPERSMIYGLGLGVCLAWFPHCWRVVGVRKD